MSYYDRCDDRNREAYKQGERDADRGWRSHRYDYDSYSERGNAYEDGYRQERYRIEEREEERRREEREEERRLQQEREWERQRQEEEEYYRQMEELQETENPELLMEKEG